MASAKSSTNKYQWSDGSWHSITEAEHQSDVGGGTVGIGNQVLTPTQYANGDLLNAMLGKPAGTPIAGYTPPSQAAPPVGTYDPSIDYNAGASQRGYDNASDDAATQYEQGQQAYGLSKGDIATALANENADYGTQTGNLTNSYRILGDQEAEKAAQSGITSAGILGQSTAVRGANQAHDQSALDTTHSRNVAGLNEDQTKLDLSNADTYGGFNGATLLDSLTGQPVVGSLVTQLTRSGVENQAFQNSSAAERSQQAAAMQYAPPTPVFPKYTTTALTKPKVKIKTTGVRTP